MMRSRWTAKVRPKKLLPLINDGGRIINISTGLTRFTTPDTIPYASLKGAIEVFTVYLAKELGARGITVNALKSRVA